MLGDVKGRKSYSCAGMPVERKKEVRKRRVRRAKLAKLRKRYQAAKTEEEKSKILQKVSQVAPGLTLEQFLSGGKREGE